MNHNNPSKSSWFDFLFVRSVPAVIWVFIILMLGLLAYSSMVKESLPDLEIPEASIITTWPGATPAMMEKEVTQRIETALKGMKGLKHIHSSSFEETSIIAVRFHADRKLGESMQLLRRRVAEARDMLPKQVKRPRIEETSVRDMPIASFALMGRSSKADLQDHARKLKRRFEKIPGIKKAVLIGVDEEVVKVRLHPARLRAMGISPALVRERIKHQNYDASWGVFENPEFKFNMKMTGIYRNLADLRELPIQRLPSGGMMRLGDLADVSHGFMPEKTKAALSWEGGGFTPVILIELFKSPGRDTVKLVGAARQEAGRASQGSAWPKGMVCKLAGNEAEAIDEELGRGFNNGWQAMLAVFLVLLAMLTWREAMVAAALIPLTLLGSLAVLWACGFTFNLLMIVGMILALGLLVDDFILILEGLHEGVFIKKMTFVQSIRHTIGSYAVPSLSGSVTTILVLLPLAFVGGVDGKFIRLIPVTAAVCLAVSYLLSIVLAPPLSRLAFSGGKKISGPGFMDRASEKAGRGLAGWLRKSVVGNRRTACIWIIGALGLFALSLGLFSQMNDTLYPQEDGRQLGVLLELPPDADLGRSSAVADKLGEALRQKPYFQHVMKVVGQRPSFSISSYHDMMSPNKAHNLLGFNCMFTPRKERGKLGHEYAEPLRRELMGLLADEPGARLFMTVQAGGPSGEDPLQIDIQGEGMGRLTAIARQVRLKLQTVPGVVDIRDNIGCARSELVFRPVRESMEYHGVGQEELARQMTAYMEHEKIGMYRRPGTQDDLPIRLGAWWPSQEGKMARGPKSWEELEGLYVVNTEGKPVSLWNLTEPAMGQARGVIPHKECGRSVTVMAKLSGVYVSEVISLMRPVMDEMQKGWPKGYSYVFAGEKEVEEETYGNILKVFVLALALVYAILALVFDSLAQPAIILSTVLFALTGVFFGFFFTGRPFSFTAAIGIVTLVGIVVNDAIVIVNTMNGYLKKGLGMAESALAGVSDRLRPIVSTTVTNLAGLTPLALSDPGWAPLCLAVIYGEIAATLGAVILVPALYVSITPGGKAVGR